MSVNSRAVITVLRIFKNSTLIMPQGEFKISRIFPTGKAANKAGYVSHCTSNGIDIYTRRNSNRKARFAVIGE
jgi:hypothetical protein